METSGCFYKLLSHIIKNFCDFYFDFVQNKYDIIYFL